MLLLAKQADHAPITCWGDFQTLKQDCGNTFEAEARGGRGSTSRQRQDQGSSTKNEARRRQSSLDLRQG